jgi:hypothetical protein
MELSIGDRQEQNRHRYAIEQSKTATGHLQPVAALAVDGAPSTTRTCDLLDRNQTLYPTELWARFKAEQKLTELPTTPSTWRWGQSSANPSLGQET